MKNAYNELKTVEHTFYYRIICKGTPDKSTIRRAGVTDEREIT